MRKKTYPLNDIIEDVSEKKSRGVEFGDINKLDQLYYKNLIIYREDGYDKIYRTPFNDSILGGPGNDLLEGKGGNDRMHGNEDA